MDQRSILLIVSVIFAAASAQWFSTGSRYYSRYDGNYWGRRSKYYDRYGYNDDRYGQRYPNYGYYNDGYSSRYQLEPKAEFRHYRNYDPDPAPYHSPHSPHYTYPSSYNNGWGWSSG